ncbi:DUF3085 domain-containing protein [Nocardia fluminea]|uniref:DUF3085 domain-containing protein n=1 Tax=Nocardia fluminea TaxID=134984 RepID=UPI00365FE541
MRTHIGEFELRFPLNQVSTIAEHAMAATEHSWPTWDDDKPNPVPPSLVWAKDQGTYLLSNGVPRLLADPAKPEGSSQVVYALGYDSYFNFTDTAVGGDDFAEYISLTDEQEGRLLSRDRAQHQPYGRSLARSWRGCGLGDTRIRHPDPSRDRVLRAVDR